MAVAGVAGFAVGPVLHAVAYAVPLGEPVWPLRRPTPSTVAVSVATASLAALVTAHLGTSWLLPAQLWLVGLAVVLTVTDLRHRRLPNAVLLPGGVVLAALMVLGAVAEHRALLLWGALGGAAGLFAVFLLAALISPAGIGMGDVKLAGVLGLVLGPAGFGTVLLAVLVAFAVHAVLAVALLATRQVSRGTGLPFGPALLLGAAAALGWFAPLSRLLL